MSEGCFEATVVTGNILSTGGSQAKIGQL